MKLLSPRLLAILLFGLLLSYCSGVQQTPKRCNPKPKKGGVTREIEALFLSLSNLKEALLDKKDANEVLSKVEKLKEALKNINPKDIKGYKELNQKLNTIEQKLIKSLESNEDFSKGFFDSIWGIIGEIIGGFGDGNGGGNGNGNGNGGGSGNGNFNGNGGGMGDMWDNLFPGDGSGNNAAADDDGSDNYCSK